MVGVSATGDRTEVLFCWPAGCANRVACSCVFFTSNSVLPARRPPAQPVFCVSILQIYVQCHGVLLGTTGMTYAFYKIWIIKKQNIRQRRNNSKENRKSWRKQRSCRALCRAFGRHLKTTGLKNNVTTTRTFKESRTTYPVRTRGKLLANRSTTTKT